jgi:hypothetical protein
VAWFTPGEIFDRWEKSGSERFLWIHGNPMFLILFLPWVLLILPVRIDSGLWENYPKVFRYPTRYIHGNSYLHQVRQSSTTRSVFPAPEHHLYSTSSLTLRTRESKITVPYFPRSSYNCDQFDSCFKILFDMYFSHKQGEQQPSEDALTQCLKDMLLGSGQSPIYLIIDALDECPDTSKILGAPPSRQKVLDVVKELVELRLLNLHICVISRPEADIRSVLEPLAHFKVSLHDQGGQKGDIANYVYSVIYSDKEQEMKR